MRTVVVDTNILIDNVHGFAPWVDTFLKSPQAYRLVIPTIVIAEYLTAQEVEKRSGRAKTEEYLSLFFKQDLTEEIAEILGRILRQKTYSPSAGFADLIIAATTIFLNAKLATNNKTDFKDILDLKFFDPKPVPTGER